MAFKSEVLLHEPSSLSVATASGIGNGPCNPTVPILSHALLEIVLFLILKSRYSCVKPVTYNSRPRSLFNVMHAANISEHVV